MLDTGTVLPVSPFVIAKSMSLSVTMPTIAPESPTTIRLPMFFSHIMLAASSTVEFSDIVTGGTSIRSLTLVLNFSDFLGMENDWRVGLDRNRSLEGASPRCDRLRNARNFGPLNMGDHRHRIQSE